MSITFTIAALWIIDVHPFEIVTPDDTYKVYTLDQSEKQ